MGVTILAGDVRAMLATLPAESVQVCVTSPPYFALRDYGTATWEGGESACDHRQPSGGTKTFGNPEFNVNRPSRAATLTADAFYTDICGKCGATRTDQQIGLEATPAEFIATLVGVFDEVRRVMRPDGVLFVNLGDSYAGSGKGPSKGIQNSEKRQGFTGERSEVVEKANSLGYRDPFRTGSAYMCQPSMGVAGVKAKSLLLIPERFAIAMQDAGWIVRSRIAWCKTSAIPESVRDRPTSAWEHIWMFTRSARYYWDQEAVRQPASPNAHPMKAKGGVRSVSPKAVGPGLGIKMNGSFHAATSDSLATSNLRNFWLLGPEPSREQHYAAYPSEIPRRCILAATSEKGQCPACGSPWVRVVEREQVSKARNVAPVKFGNGRNSEQAGSWTAAMPSQTRVVSTTTGWQSGCQCNAGDPIPQLVLDPFLGSGTTALVADQLGRNAIGIELNPTYAEMARKRITNDCPMFTDVEVAG